MVHVLSAGKRLRHLPSATIYLPRPLLRVDDLEGPRARVETGQGEVRPVRKQCRSPSHGPRRPGLSVGMEALALLRKPQGMGGASRAKDTGDAPDRRDDPR